MNRCSARGHPRVLAVKDFKAVSAVAARTIEEELRHHPALLLCASAGASWSGCYAELARKRVQNPKLFRRMRLVQIDEWAGLPPGHPASCRHQLEAQLVKPLRIDPERFCGFQSDPAKPGCECARVQRWLDANGPIDVCLVGLGLNGHIAMNEPAAELCPRVHVARLSPGSMKHGMLSSLKRKPKYGLSLGMADILRSRKVLLVASGESKRVVLRRLLQPGVSTQFPASFLWLHPNATIICDRAVWPQTGK